MLVTRQVLLQSIASQLDAMLGPAPSGCHRAATDRAAAPLSAPAPSHLGTALLACTCRLPARLDGQRRLQRGVWVCVGRKKGGDVVELGVGAVRHWQTKRLCHGPSGSAHDQSMTNADECLTLRARESFAFNGALRFLAFPTFLVPPGLALPASGPDSRFSLPPGGRCGGASSAAAGTVFVPWPATA